MEELRYEDADIDARILRAVKELGYEVMTPIQSQGIPVMLEGKDVIGQAQTGTGKTAAFGIPIMQNTDPENGNLQAIVLCPTRELAVQAAEEIRKYGKYMSGIKVLPVYGGQDIMKQIRSLKGNVQIVVGTPGRVMDHMRRHTLKLDHLKTIVLDEADEMLDMGFREDIEMILKEIPAEHQTALFSATMPKPILDITQNYQKEDAVFLKMPAKELTIPLVKQYYYEVSRKNKEEVVARLLDYYNPKRTLIFCNTKRMVDDLTENLVGRGYFAEGLHGDLSQAQRDRVMAGFRNGQVEILIATDVAARGIDVDDVEAVFNYDIPQDIEYYVHRIGRTGRAGKKGRAFTLVVGREVYKIRDIERVCKTKVEARSVPSAADIKSSKSEKILNRILEVHTNNDLTDMIRIIEQKLNDDDCTAIELAAAFLKEQMGDDKEDIPDEKFTPEKRDYSGKSGGGRGRYGDRDRNGSKDGRRSRSDRERGDSHYERHDRDDEYRKKRFGGDSAAFHESEVFEDGGSRKKYKNHDDGEKRYDKLPKKSKTDRHKDDRDKPDKSKIDKDKVKARDLKFDGTLKKKKNDNKEWWKSSKKSADKLWK